MIPKGNLASVDWADIETLIAQQAREDRSLEFKRDPVGPKDEDKREFLADISAFANTTGGDVIFGINAVGGVATSLSPLCISDTDAEERRLDAILRSGVEPRMPRYEFKWIGADKGWILIIRIPRSWSAPHRVIFRDHSKFYARSTAGKYAMDVAELRAAFGASESLIERIRAFRRERMNALHSDEAPILLNKGAKLLFHVLPLSAFSNPLTIPTDERTLFPPLRASGFNFLHTLEGFATYSGAEDAESSRTYTLLFRNGILEVAAHVGYEGERGLILYPESVEGGLLRVLPLYFQNLTKLGVEQPFYVSLGLLSVKGYALYTGDRFFSSARRPVRRDTLIFPELFLDTDSPDFERVLRPLFDLLWQAFGYPKSFSFDSNGKYRG